MALLRESRESNQVSQLHGADTLHASIDAAIVIGFSTEKTYLGPMELRLPYDQLSPDAHKGLYATFAQINRGSLDKAFLELIYLRVSQMNGCAYCMERHAQALRSASEPDQRIDTLAGWRLSPHFTDAERAALAWTEAVTEITRGQAPDELFLALKGHFSSMEISDLSFAITVMNALNRLAISMRR